MLDLILDQDPGSDYTRFDLVLRTSFKIILLNFGFCITSLELKNLNKFMAELTMLVKTSFMMRNSINTISR